MSSPVVRPPRLLPFAHPSHAGADVDCASAADGYRGHEPVQGQRDGGDAGRRSRDAAEGLRSSEI